MALEGILGTVSGWGGSFGVAAQMILGLVVIGLLGYLIIYWLSFKTSVNIYERRGETTLKIRDKGKEVRKKKERTTEFQLLKNKQAWSGPLKSKYFIPVKKSFGLGYEVNFRRDEEGNLEPIMPPETANLEWTGLAQADVRWAMMEAKEGVQVYSKDDGWEKWVTTLAPIVSVGIVLVLVIVVLQNLEPLAQAFQSAATAFAQAQANAPVVAN